MRVNDRLLMGVPRGGTTLACQLAGRAHNAISLFEPINVEALGSDHEMAIAAVGTFLTDTRQQLSRGGTAISKQRDGGVPDNPFGPPDASGQRQLSVALGPIGPANPLSEDFTLVVKHNAAFAALLPELTRVARCVAVVRHPVDVLASWASVPLPVREGWLPAGERFDPILARTLRSENGAAERQLIILNWFFDRFANHLTNDCVVRYEDIVASQGGVLWDALGVTAECVPSLQARGAHGRLAAALPALALLRRGGGAWEQWYPRETLLDVLNHLDEARI